MSLFHVPSATNIVDERRQLHPVWNQLLNNIAALLNQGVPAAKNSSSGVPQPQSITIVTAKLTTGGTAGSLTFTNGILTAYVAAT